MGETKQEAKEETTEKAIERQAVEEIITGDDDTPDRLVLPRGWHVVKQLPNGAQYTNGKLVAVLNAAEAKDGNVVVHVAVRTIGSKRRPTSIEMLEVRRALFSDRRGRVIENNQTFPTSELTRQLWQVIGAEVFDPESVVVQ